MSNYKIEKMNKSEYYSKFGFVKKESELKCPLMKKGKYYLIGKFIVEIPDDSTDIMLSIFSTDNYLLKYFEYKITTKNTEQKPIP